MVTLQRKHEEHIRLSIWLSHLQVTRLPDTHQQQWNSPPSLLVFWLVLPSPQHWCLLATKPLKMAEYVLEIASESSGALMALMYATFFPFLYFHRQPLLLHNPEATFFFLWCECMLISHAGSQSQSQQDWEREMVYRSHCIREFETASRWWRVLVWDPQGQGQ
jgi:hypothetical protein